MGQPSLLLSWDWSRENIKNPNAHWKAEFSALSSVREIPLLETLIVYDFCIYNFRQLNCALEEDQIKFAPLDVLKCCVTIDSDIRPKSLMTRVKPNRQINKTIVTSINRYYLDHEFHN